MADDLDEFDALVKGKGGVPAVVVSSPASSLAVTKRDVQHLEAWARNETYPGISERPVSEDQATALTEPLSDEEVDIKPDSFGAVYLSHAGYRRRLNKAFRPAGWALRRLTPYTFDKDRQIAYAEFALYGEGRYLGSSLGEQRIPENNSEMSHGDIIEGLKSNALMRACKDLGMAMEAWDLKWTADFRKRLCVRVWVKPPYAQKAKLQWRRLDAEPFFGETGCAEDSPNREKYAASRKQNHETVKASQLDGLDDELKTSIEKGFELVGLTAGARTTKIAEFLGGELDASQRAAQGAKLYDWLKNEYSKKKTGQPMKAKEADNSKKAPVDAAMPTGTTATTSSAKPRGDAPPVSLGAPAGSAADSQHSTASSDLF